MTLNNMYVYNMYDCIADAGRCIVVSWCSFVHYRLDCDCACCDLCMLCICSLYACARVRSHGSFPMRTALCFSNAGLGRPLVKMSDGWSSPVILYGRTSGVAPVASSRMRYTRVSMCLAQLYIPDPLTRYMHALLSCAMGVAPLCL